MSLATLTRQGRAAIALAISAQPLHIAWGTGDSVWDADGKLPSLVDWTRLVNETGRRTPGIIGFVEPDDAGGIVIPVSATVDGKVQEMRYRRVTGPTPYIYLQANYDYADACNVIIREMGVFMGTKVHPELPPGQRYFKPSDIADPGLLLAAQIIKPSITRSPSVRQSVEFVLPI